MWVFPREMLDVVVDVGADVGGGGPDVAILEDEFSDAWDEGCVPVGGF